MPPTHHTDSVTVDAGGEVLTMRWGGDVAPYVGIWVDRGAYAAQAVVAVRLVDVIEGQLFGATSLPRGWHGTISDSSRASPSRAFSPQVRPGCFSFTVHTALGESEVHTCRWTV